MTAQLLILAEQTVEYQRGKNIDLLPLKTKDESLSIELQFCFSKGSYKCCNSCGDYCGHRSVQSANVLRVSSSKCPYPVTVDCSVLGPDRNKLLEKVVPLQTDSSAIDVSIVAPNGKVIVRIAVHAVDSTPPAKGARLCLNPARLEGNFCDLKLVVEGVELPAHRLVLAARSPVLANMLTGRSEEVPEGRVEVADFSKLAVEKFLEFLYTDQVEDWGACEVELLQLAAKYEVPQLTTACTLQLWGCEGVEALKLLHAAGLSEVLGRPLRRRLTAVVLAAMETMSLADTKEWKEFESSYPVLAHTMTPLAEECDNPASQTGGGREVAGVGRCLNRARLDGYHCDVKLVVEGAELPAHLVVLGARSPVLDKMLTGSFKEAAEGRVELVDFSKAAVEKFLEYLYTDEIVTWAGCEVELLLLADKYMVPELRAYCDLELWHCPTLWALNALHAAGLCDVFSSRVRGRLSKKVSDDLQTLANTWEWGEFQAVYSVVADTILGFSDREMTFSIMAV